MGEKRNNKIPEGAFVGIPIPDNCKWIYITNSEKAASLHIKNLGTKPLLGTGGKIEPLEYPVYITYSEDPAVPKKKCQDI